MPRTSVDDQKQEAEDFGRRLSWVREMVGAIPTRLAADCGVDTSSIRHIERGQRMPSVHLLRTLCHVLRISPDYLLYGSLAGVDQELATKLKVAHPELNWPAASPAPDNRRNSPPNSARRPRIQQDVPSVAGAG
jgi:transcriptional regulator with XRE-family HTH domain